MFDKNRNPTFQLSIDNQKHCCEPKKYEPEKYRCFRTTDFFYFRQKGDAKDMMNLAIYHPNDRSQCFTFGYCKSEKNFVCRKCAAKKRRVSMRIIKDANGEEYLNHIFTRHLCKPIKAATICEAKYIIFQRNEFSMKEKVNIQRSEENAVDEAKIVRKPNFELQPSQNGVPENRLIIYLPGNRDLYYRYYYQTDNKNYRCAKCTTLKQYVKAKLYINNENEKYIVMGENEHVCEPLNLEKTEIFHSPNFIIFEKDDVKNTKKLFIFTTSTQKLGYEFSYIKNNKRFRCFECNRLNKNVFAVLIKNENDEECIKVTEEHICAPKNLESSEFQTRKIPASLFLLCPNSTGKEDKTLLVFASDQKDSVFSYSSKGGSFYCVKCSIKKQRVKAKVLENEDGEKYVKHIGPDHVCIPKKFDPEKYGKIEVKPEIIPETMFLLVENRRGESNKRVLIFTSETREFVYKFHWNNGNYYICTKCHEMRAYVGGNLKTTENGEKYFEMKKAQHICTPQKYEPKLYKPKTIIPETLFEIRENKNGRKDGKLIIFTSETKKLAYNYCWMFKDTYYCTMCRNMKCSGVNAKIFENENSEKFAELSLTAHACKPRSYESLIF